MMVLLFLFSGATCKFINQKITNLVTTFRVTLILVTLFSQINHFVMNNIYCHPFCVFFEVCFARAEKWKSKAPSDSLIASSVYCNIIIVSSKCLPLYPSSTKSSCNCVKVE